MPRSAAPPRLVLFGPDDKHGAKPKKGFVEYIWYIVWSEGGDRKEKSTGASLHQQVDAGKALSDFIIARSKPEVPPGGHRPHEINVGRVLELYGQEYAPEKISAAQIGYAIKAMWPFWAGRLLSEVSAKTCQDYIKWRTRQPSKNYLTSLEAWKRRRDRAKESLRSFIEPEPQRKTISRRKARDELTYLSAAIGYCRENVYITEAPPVTLPEREESSQICVERSDFAKLLLAARQKVVGKPNIRRHLIVFMKIGVYQPARKTAILTLPLVQSIGGGAWLDAKAGVIDFGPGKGNKKRPRQVPIHPRILVYVRGAARRGQTYLVEMVGKVLDEKGKPVRVRGPDGKWVVKMSHPISDVRRSFAAAAKRADLGKRVTPHTLRHTGVSWLKHAGVESWMVGEYAGMTKETVDRIYAHSPRPDRMQVALDALTKKRRT